MLGKGTEILNLSLFRLILINGKCVKTMSMGWRLSNHKTHIFGKPFLFTCLMSYELTRFALMLTPTRIGYYYTGDHIYFLKDKSCIKGVHESFVPQVCNSLSGIITYRAIIWYNDI